MLRFLRNLFAPTPSPKVIAAREKIYFDHFGVDPAILHSTDHVFPHVDLYDFPPTAKRPWHTLVTGGMGEYRQPAIAETVPLRAELILQVRDVLPVHHELLKMLAEYPARHETALGYFHTVPIGEPWSEGSEVGAVLLGIPEEADVVGLALELDGEAVEYLLTVPITTTEREFAMEVGSTDLFEKLRAANLLVHSDDRRGSIVSRPFGASK